MENLSKFYFPHYIIDWSKVTDLSDVIRILKMLDITLTEEAYAESDIKDLLKLVSKREN